MKVNEIVSFMNTKGQNIKRVKGAAEYLKEMEVDFSISIPKDVKTYMSIAHDIKDVHGIVTAFDDEGEDSYVTLIPQSVDEPFKEYRRIWELYKKLLKDGYIPIGFYLDAGPFCVDTKNNNVLVFIDEDSWNKGEDELYYRTVITDSMEEYFEIYFSENDEEDEEEDNEEDTIQEEDSLDKVDNEEFDIVKTIVKKGVDGRSTNQFKEAQLLFAKWFPDTEIIADEIKKQAGKPEVSWVEVLKGLDELIDQNIDYEFEATDHHHKNKKYRLSEINHIHQAVIKDKKVVYFDVLEDVWMKYYDEHIKYPMVLIQMAIDVLMFGKDCDYGISEHEWASRVYGKVYGEVRTYKYPVLLKGIIKYYVSHILEDLENYKLENLSHIDRNQFYFGWIVVDYLCKKESLFIDINAYPNSFGDLVNEAIRISEHTLSPALLGLSYFSEGVMNNPEFFDLGFTLLNQFLERPEWKETEIVDGTRSGLLAIYFEPYESLSLVAALRNLISIKDYFGFDLLNSDEATYDDKRIAQVLKDVFDLYRSGQVAFREEQGEEMGEKDPNYFYMGRLKDFFTDKMTIKEYINLIKPIYMKISDYVIRAELSRGKRKSAFSDALVDVDGFFGAEHIANLLKALEDVGIVKGKSVKTAANSLWAHLIKNSHPDVTEDKDLLRKLIREKNISKSIVDNMVELVPEWSEYV